MISTYGIKIDKKDLLSRFFFSEDHIVESDAFAMTIKSSITHTGVSTELHKEEMKASYHKPNISIVYSGRSCR